MKANAAQIKAGLDKPGDAIRLYLLHGPDEAGATELALRLQRAMGPEAERVDLDGAALRARPGLLAEEAASLSLFGGARFIRVRAVGDESLGAVDQLLSAERAGNPVVMIAPGLKTTSKLVKFALPMPAALVHGCYLPEGEEAGRLAAAIAREEGIRLEPSAARELAQAAAGDRAVMAREIEKLALYLDAAPDRPREADRETMAAIGADLSESRSTALVTALIEGNAGAAARELSDYAREGESMIGLLRTLQRRLLQLAELRAQVDAGAPLRQVVARSGTYEREQPALARQLERWSAARLAQALERIAQTERGLKRSANAGDSVASTMLSGMARAGARRG